MALLVRAHRCLRRLTDLLAQRKSLRMVLGQQCLHFLCFEGFSVLLTIHNQYKRFFVRRYQPSDSFEHQFRKFLIKRLPKSFTLKANPDITTPSAFEPSMIADIIDGKWMIPGLSLSLRLGLWVATSVFQKLPNPHRDYPPAKPCAD